MASLFHDTVSGQTDWSIITGFSEAHSWFFDKNDMEDKAKTFEIDKLLNKYTYIDMLV